MNTNYKNLRKLGQALMYTALVAVASIVWSCSDDAAEVTPIPSISSINPTSAEPGDNVTITGTDLTDALSVTFNTGIAAIVSNSDTEIVATVPEDGSTGKVSVATAGGAAVSSSDFTVVIIGAADVTAVSAKSAEAGANVVLTGTEMATATSVSVGEIEATIVSATDTSIEITVGAGSALGLNTITVVNQGGTSTTSVESVPFYVIKTLDPVYRLTFDNDDVENVYSGSPDTEESGAYGRSDDATNVADVAMALPSAVDGTFFHMEGYSSTDFSGSYICYAGAQTTTDAFVDFFTGAATEDIYFNVQLNVGDLPEDYTGAEDDGQMVVGLRFRFADDYYEYSPTLKELTDLGGEADANGWISVSAPASLFIDRADLGTFEFTTMNRIGLAVRRNYGSGTTLPLSDDPNAVFYSLSFDNANVSIGGPVY